MLKIKPIITYQVKPDINLEEVNIRLTEHSRITDFALLRQVIDLCSYHQIKPQVCEIVNIGTKEITNVPIEEKEYEKVIENELSILIFKN